MGEGGGEGRGEAGENTPEVSWTKPEEAVAVDVLLEHRISWFSVYKCTQAPTISQITTELFPNLLSLKYIALTSKIHILMFLVSEDTIRVLKKNPSDNMYS